MKKQEVIRVSISKKSLLFISEIVYKMEISEQAEIAL